MSHSVSPFAYHARRVLGRVREARLPTIASALAFTTVLALVPLLTVSVAVLSMFPFFEQWGDAAQNLLYENLIPATGDVVRTYLEEFAGHAGSLTGLGLVTLVITALLLLSTIEDAFNEIWGMKKGRTFAQRILLYWTLLTLGPVLIALSLSLTSYLGAWVVDELAPEMNRSAFGLWLVQILPIILEGIGFLLMYLIVPSRAVPVRFALLGAGIAVALFELSKYGFVLFISNFPTYQIIYGALWTIPVFLVWIYLSWLVTLVGACVSAEMTHSTKTAVATPKVPPVMGGKPRAD